MMLGVAVFLVADQIVERRFGSEGTGGAMGIVVGSVIDGVPESAILGIQVGIGMTISLGFVGAVFISNIPQAIAPSADLAASGWGPRRLGQLWLLVVLACGVAAALGFLATDLLGAVQANARRPSRQEACSRNSLIPFSFERGGSLAGAATALGFCLSVMGG